MSKTPEFQPRFFKQADQKLNNEAKQLNRFYDAAMPIVRQSPPVEN